MLLRQFSLIEIVDNGCPGGLLNSCNIGTEKCASETVWHAELRQAKLDKTVFTFSLIYIHV